jgi:hypothetical protein
MILLLKLTLFGAGLALLYSWCFEMVFTNVFSKDENQYSHFAINILLGMAVLSGLLGFWSLFLRVDALALKVFSVLPVLILGAGWKYFLVRIKILFQQVIQLGVIAWACFSVFLIFALYMAASASVTYDTGLYHAQSIRWIETYPVIKGAANIHDRLGFNSSLFLLAAFFGFSWEGWHSYQVPGLILFSGFSIYSLYILGNDGRRWLLSKWVAGGYFVYLWLEKGMIIWFASPTADLSSAFTSWAIFLLAMNYIEHEDAQPSDLKMAVLFSLGLFNVALKVSSLPVVLIGLYFIWQRRGVFFPKVPAILFFVFTIVLAPWLLRNMLISGYLVFPFYQLDILPVDWKVPYHAAVTASQTIRAWGFVPYENPSAVMAMSFSEWFPKWMNTLPPADTTVLYLLIAGIFALLVFEIYRGWREYARYAPIYFVIIAGCAYWFLQSPSPRFGYGFLIPMVFFQFAPWLNFLFEKMRARPGLIFGSICLALALQVVYFAGQFPLKSWKRYLNTYKTYPTVDTFHWKAGWADVYTPVVNEKSIVVLDAQCWYDPFPCSPFPIDGLSMRGKTIEDGFYIKGNQ